MSYQAESYMLVGFPYENRSFIERAVEWCKENDCSFKEKYKKQMRVAELMPKYEKDLEELNQQALEVFYGYLEDKDIVRIEEHRGHSYIGFPVDSSVSINDEVLEQFCQTVKQKSSELYQLLGKKGALISTHNYS